MARLTRKNQKVFAGSAANNGQFGSAQAGTKVTSADVEILQNLAAFLNGWNDAIISGQKLPPLEEFQALNYINTYQLSYLFQEGIPEWNSATEYHQYSIVKKTGTYELYGSAINTNTGNALPSAVSNANWTYLGSLSDVVRFNGSAPVDNALARFDSTTGKIIQRSGVTVDDNNVMTLAGSSSAGSAIRLSEDTDNGTNYVGLKAPDSIASNLTLTVPSSVGSSGQSLITDGSGVLSFAGAVTTGTEGSITLPSGLIMKWGLTAGIVASSNSTIAFPVAFPTACYNVQATVNTVLADRAPRVDTLTASNFKIYNDDSVGTHQYMWFAIGA